MNNGGIKGGEAATVYLLTSTTVAILGIQRLLPAQLIPDLPTVTAALVANVEVWIGVVHAVRCPTLPRVQLAFCAAVVAIVAIAPVRGGFFGHGFGGLGVELVWSLLLLMLMLEGWRLERKKWNGL